MFVPHYALGVVGRRTLLTQHRLELSDVAIKPRDSLEILGDLLAWRPTKLLADLPDKWHEHIVVVVDKLLDGYDVEGVAAILLIRPTKD